MSYTSTVSAPLRFIPFLAENFPRRSHECSFEKINFVGSNGVLRVFGSIYFEYSQYFGVLYCGYSILQVFGVRYCGYSGTRSALTSHTPQYSQYSGLRYCSYSQHSQYSGLQYCSYSQYSQYKMYSILRVYLKYEVYWQHLCII